MNRYLVLYRSEGAMGGMSVSEMFANATPEQLQAGMAAWKSWYEKSGGAVVDLGAPLDKSTLISGGEAAANRSSITGYSILQAGSVDEAVSLIKAHPHFHMPGSTIEVLECVPMPGM